jgi:hypothetical protein
MLLGRIAIHVGQVHKGNDNELCFSPTMYQLSNFVFLKNEICNNNLHKLHFMLTVVLNLTDEYYKFYNFVKLTNLKKLHILNTCFYKSHNFLNFYLRVKYKNSLMKSTV